MTRRAAVVMAGVCAGVAYAFLLAPGGERDGAVTSSAPHDRASEPAAKVDRSINPPPSVPEVAWVSPAGNDRATGTAADPWNLPQRAVDSGARMVRLLPGRHPGFVVNHPGLIVRGGGPGHTTVVGQIRVQANGVRLERLSVTGAEGPYEAAILVDGVTDVTLSESRVHGNTFGLLLRNAERATVSRNEITRNGAGIEVHGLVGGTAIEHNDIHDNDRAVDDSRGANGVVFFRAAGPVTVRGNNLWSNYNPSPAAGTDPGGGAFEVYASTDVRIQDNTIWDSSILESGTEGDRSCRGLVFLRNVAWRGEADQRQEGLVLRCAEDGLVAHNTLDGFDRFAVDVIHMAGPFAGSVEGLRVVNNILVNGRAYSIDNQLPASVLIDHNLVFNPGSTAQDGDFIAYVAGRGNTRSPDEMRAWGLDPGGLYADPRFVSRDRRDYRVSPSSPAVDAGMQVPDLEAPDGRPDIGWWEVPRP